MFLWLGNLLKGRRESKETTNGMASRLAFQNENSSKKRAKELESRDCVLGILVFQVFSWVLGLSKCPTDE